MKITRYELIPILSIFVIVCLFMINNSVPKLNIHHDEYIQKVKQFNTGDIFFLSGDTIGERVCRWLGNSPFSHVGMIINEGGKLFALECDAGQGAKAGVRIINFMEKLYRFRGDVVAIKRLVCKPNDIPTVQKVLLHAKRYLQKDLDDKMIKWLFSDIPILKDLFYNPNEMFCSEFIYELYSDLQIIQRMKCGSSVTPNDFVMNRLSFHSNYSFGNVEYYKIKTLEGE